MNIYDFLIESLIKLIDENKNGITINVDCTENMARNHIHIFRKNTSGKYFHGTHLNKENKSKGNFHTNYDELNMDLEKLKEVIHEELRLPGLIVDGVIKIRTQYEVKFNE